MFIKLNPKIKSEKTAGGIVLPDRTNTQLPTLYFNPSDISCISIIEGKAKVWIKGITQSYMLDELQTTALVEAIEPRKDSEPVRDIERTKKKVAA